MINGPQARLSPQPLSRFASTAQDSSHHPCPEQVREISYLKCSLISVKKNKKKTVGVIKPQIRPTQEVTPFLASLLIYMQSGPNDS